jgi:hypothetical protein
MDLDLKEGWEKKALIVVAVVVIIIFVYAFNPFKPAANVTTENQSTVPTSQISTPVTPAPTITNNSSNNTNNTITTLITADQAKAIAESANKGYKASDPMQGTVVVNGTTVAVWIVPLKSGAFSSKTAYIDITTGRIVQQT